MQKPRYIYAGLNGAGLVKLGATTCPVKREKTFQCADPQFRMMFYWPESNVTEIHFLRKMRELGFQVGRSREVFDVSLSLVSDLMNGAEPRGGKSGRSLLAEFLAAELEPGLSIEEACYPSIVLFNMKDQPNPHQLAHGRRLLQAAGLVYLEHDAFEPGYVKLDFPLKFAERFPHLKHLIPFVLHSEGVWVLSGAAPVAHKGPTLVKHSGAVKLTSV